MTLNSLDQRITLEAPTYANDGKGGRTVIWQAFATVWASVTPRAQGSTLDADAIQKPVRYDITLRTRHDITKAMRVVWGSRTLTIDSVLTPSTREPFMALIAIDTSKIG